MLRIYFDDEEIVGKEVVTNIEKEFRTLQLEGTKLERMLIEKIEQGKYLDSAFFIDRFGCKLYNENLSTGCKAALCVVKRPEKIVSIMECGLNARDFIIIMCNDGNILMRSDGLSINNRRGKDIDVQIDNYRFTTVNRLNRYLSDERPFKPDMLVEGVEYVSDREL